MVVVVGEAAVEVVVAVGMHFLWRSEIGSGVWVRAFSRLNSSSILFACRDLLKLDRKMRTSKTERPDENEVFGMLFSLGHCG